jgi:hypothetical protein
VAAAYFAGAWVASLDAAAQQATPERILVGTVAPGQLLKAGMTITNTGDSRLVVSNRLPSGNDAGQVRTTWIVEPHQKQFVTGKISAPKWAGPFLRRVEFATSNPDAPTRSVEIAGIVDESLLHPNSDVP